MKFKSTLILTILLISFIFSDQIQAENIGFENDLSGWKCYNGTVHEITPDLINNIDQWTMMDAPLIQFPERFNIINNSEFNNYDGECEIIPLNTIMGSKFLKLGYEVAGKDMQKVAYSFQFSQEHSLIKYGYAIVLQEPKNGVDHDKEQRPTFMTAITIKHKHGNLTLNGEDNCATIFYYGDKSVFPDLNECKNPETMSKNWSYNLIDLESLGAMSGDSITLTFATFDCTRGGHFGYAYVDAEFVDSKFDIDGVSGSSVCAGESVTFSYPGSNLYVGESYEWRIDGQKVSNQQSFEHKFETVGSHTVSLTIKVKNESIDTNSCVVERVITDIVNVVKCFCPESPRITLDGVSLGESFSLCKDKMYDFKFAAGVPMTNPQYEWSWNSESSSSSGSEDSYSLQATQSGRLSVLMTSEECKKGVTVSVDLDVAICFTKKCNDCPSKFSPQPGEKYVISGWVSAPGQLENHATSFEKVGIQMNFSNTSGSTSTFSVAPSGSIIDGWQRISGVVTIPQDAEVMRISLVNESGSDEVYYDDIRFHPFNSTMKGYVYDPVTLRLSAELDDQNYATLYEYDDEGVLVRVKKETERGVMTIRESRQSSRKTKE